MAQKKQPKKTGVKQKPKVTRKSSQQRQRPTPTAKKPVRAVGRGRRAPRSYERQFEQLVERGKKEGKLAQKEIFELIPDTPANIDVLDSLYAELAEAEIELIPEEEPSARSLSDEWVAEESEEEILKTDTSYLEDICGLHF